MWGTSQSIINNLVVGVSEGFTRKLEINGVGYRAQVQGNSLTLQLGFSHDVNYPIPEGIEIKCADQTQIEIFGANKQRVGQVAAEIRAYRPPEPYKGKGIKYDDEYILRKEGKKKPDAFRDMDVNRDGFVTLKELAETFRTGLENKDNEEEEEERQRKKAPR